MPENSHINAIKNAIKGAGFSIKALSDAMGISRQTFYNNIGQAEIDESFKRSVKEYSGVDIDEIIHSVNTPNKTTGENLRNQKAFGPSIDTGIIYVPIVAQAGYAKHFMNQVFVSDLERIYIPNSKYKGDNYAYFEVEGDSMLPTLKEGMQVLAQSVEQSDWVNIDEFYIYVIVTKSQVMVKRLAKLRDEDGKVTDDSVFLVISDNEELYPQFLIEKRTIQQLWFVKRRLDWEMSPPKMFEQKIKR